MGAGLRFILGQRLFFLLFFPADALNATARAVSSAGRASRLHREGRRFDPVTAHHLSLHHIFRCGGNLDLTAIRVARKSKAIPGAKCFGGVAQLVRALACHARGRGFESRHSRHFFQNITVHTFCVCCGLSVGQNRIPSNQAGCCVNRRHVLGFGLCLPVVSG